MLLWLAIICLTLATAFAVGRPLLRKAPIEPPFETTEAGRRAVYADQLAEIDVELARGVIGAADAEAARIEISRRLLAHETTKQTKSKAIAGDPSSGLRTAIVAFIPVLALGLYTVLGRPSLPGQPHAQQVASAQERGKGAPGAAAIDELITKVEARLREAPEDGRGWDAIAPVYLKVQRYDEARAAYARAIELLGESQKRLIGRAESAVSAANGTVTDEARDAFEKVLKVEPGRLEARFWLALAREQHGELEPAAVEYRAILAAAPPNAPWRGAVDERLAAVTGGGAVQPEKGPTANDVAASKAMSPEARQQMIAGMVERLHQRLKADGRDAAGWQKLLRAYAAMGDKPKAVAALAEARNALAGDTTGLGAIDALAREIGLGS
jgi:cytochrome c-type biogenesis protein CcmH